MTTYQPLAPEKLEAFVNTYRHQMDFALEMCALLALRTLKQRGAPDPATYSLHHIDAIDANDLNLKRYLVFAPILQDHFDGKLTAEQTDELLSPLFAAVAETITKNRPPRFPLGGDLNT